jgi:predicted Holliday junction resolvase-like endonuclease
MIEIFLLCLSIVLLLALVFLAKKFFSLKGELEDLRFRKASQSVKYGQLTEQFIPFIGSFPFDPQQFRFIGNPIDGIVFDDNAIVFCEFKAGSSGLSQRQRLIKQLVEEKKVKWLEFRID